MVRFLLVLLLSVFSIKREKGSRAMRDAQDLGQTLGPEISPIAQLVRAPH